MREPCWQPWTHLEFTHKNLLPCCHSCGEHYAPDMALLDYFNAPLMQRTRTGLAQGNLPVECKDCRWTIGRLPICVQGAEWPSIPPDFFSADFAEWKLTANRAGATPAFIENLDKVKAAWQAKSVQVSAIPPTMSLQFDQVCNIRCRMCIQKHLTPIDAVSLHVLCEVLKNHEKIGRVYVTGGEPFHSLAGRAFMWECAKTKPNFFFIITTNLSAVDLTLLEKLNVQRIQCSCSGGTKETYEFMHKGGVWDRAVETITRLSQMHRKNKNPLVVNTNYVLFTINLPELRQAIERDQKLGVRTLVSAGTPPPQFPDWELLNPQGLACVPTLRECLSIAIFEETKRSLDGIIRAIELSAKKTVAA